MSATVLYMSMSLDGYIAGPNETVDNGLGDGGHRLHDWILNDPTGANRQIADESLATGAIVAGRGTIEGARYWGGDHHDGVPIWMLSRTPDEEPKDYPLITFVDDVTTAVTEAKEAAGEKDVLLHGAGTARLALEAGVLDELEIHLIPVLLGQGRRLFDERDAEHIELERVRVLEGEDGTTHIRYRVVRR